MYTQKVVVLPYDPLWQTAFNQIKCEIEMALGHLIIGIEHIGSTAVVGMSAKPCIDIDVVIRDRSDLSKVIEGLARIGYLHEGDLGIPDREAFRYIYKPHLYKHHLYVCPQQSRELHRHITFRDFLRAHPDAVQRYSRVKEEAAHLFPNDIDGYMVYKAPCIAQLYVLCGLA